MILNMYKTFHRFCWSLDLPLITAKQRQPAAASKPQLLRCGQAFDRHHRHVPKLQRNCCILFISWFDDFLFSSFLF